MAELKVADVTSVEQVFNRQRRIVSGIRIEMSVHRCPPTPRLPFSSSGIRQSICSMRPLEILAPARPNRGSFCAAQCSRILSGQPVWWPYPYIDGEDDPFHLISRLAELFIREHGWSAQVVSYQRQAVEFSVKSC